MKIHAVYTVLFLVAAGCGTPRQAEEPQTRVTIQSSEVKAGWPELGRGDARFIRIDLGPDTFAECQRLAPKFPFDSAETYAQDGPQLSALAACLNAPGMRERTITLVGRADPRGTPKYNVGLGARRAETIKQHLVDAGIAAERITVVSQGAYDAVGGTPEYDYGYDRRVDVVIGGGSHAP
jgi:peptidoglycan-associated lipoprotein